MAVIFLLVMCTSTTVPTRSPLGINFWLHILFRSTAACNNKQSS